MNRALSELLVLTAVSALGFGMAIVFGYIVAGIVFAALFSASGTVTLRLVLRR